MCISPPATISYTHVNPHLSTRLGSCPHPMPGDMTRLSRIRFCCTCFKTIQLSSEEQKHLTLVSCFACWFFLSETIQSSPHLQLQPLGFCPHPNPSDMTRLSMIRSCCICLQLSSLEQKHWALLPCNAFWLFYSSLMTPDRSNLVFKAPCTNNQLDACVE